MTPETPSKLPHDIKGLIPYRMTLLDYLPWIAAATVVLALAFLAFWLWRKRRRVEKPAVPVDPWEALLTRLKAVDLARPFAGPAQIEFYFLLSLLLREAVELRTGIRATDSTLGELRTPLRKKLPLAPDAIEAVLAFLERADMVKFAGYEATPEEGLAAKDHVLIWTRALKPLPIVTGPAEIRGLEP